MPPDRPEPVERGDGTTPVVALLHGSMDRAAGMAAVARHLRHRRTLAFDRRGYGRSRHLAADGLDDHVDDLLALLAGRPAVVLGHSYGGCVALRAAQVAPAAVLGVVSYEAPVPWLPGWPTATAGQAAVDAGDPEPAAEAFLRRMLGDERWEALPERARADRRAEGVGLLADMRSIRPAPGAPPPVDLAAVACPVVVAHGSRGRPPHVDGAARVAAALPAGTLAVVEGAAHGAQTSHPAALAELVEGLLGRLGGEISAG